MTGFFQSYLEGLVDKKLELTINDNRSTMLSIKWEPDRTKVSMHRIFLQAPDNVMQKLACYLNRDDEMVPRVVRHYIEEAIKKLDYSHTLDPKKLITVGKCFQLQELYADVTEEYFGETLPLFITWFGARHPPRTTRSQLTLGLYHDQLRLIKVNRFLDRPCVPLFLIRYVIYHEILHFVSPSYVDDKGLHRIHSKEFRKMEQRFAEYEEAQRWIYENQVVLFRET